MHVKCNSKGILLGTQMCFDLLFFVCLSLCVCVCVCVGPHPKSPALLQTHKGFPPPSCALSFVLSFRLSDPLTHPSHTRMGGGQVLQRVVCRYKRTDPISHTAEQQLPPQHTHKTLLCRVMGNCLILLQQWDFIAVSLSLTHTRYTECNTYCNTYSTAQKGFSDAKRHLFT